VGLPRPSRQIGDRSPTLPLGGGSHLIDPEALGQRPWARLTMLYRSTDRLGRRGAPMESLAHSASFESLDKGAQSKPGTKHLTSGITKWRATRFTLAVDKMWFDASRADLAAPSWPDFEALA
jgi:hypothetical protein